MGSTRRLTFVRAPQNGVVLVALGAALWGLDALIRKPLVDGGWSSWTIVLYEHLVLTAVVAPFLAMRIPELRRLDARGWAALLVIAWGGSAIATLAFTTAFAYGNPTVVLLLQKTQPLWAVAAAALVVGELPRPQFVLYVVPATVGIYLLSFGSMHPADAFQGAQGRAALLALVAAALWGAGTALGRLALRQLSVGTLTAARVTFAVPLLLGIAAWHAALLPPDGASAGDWTRLPLLALVPGLLALTLYYSGLRTTPAPVATLAELAFPATAIVVNYVFFDAVLTGVQAIGFAVLWGTIALLHRLPVRLPSDREPALAVGG
jgi:drug/metabolite transporter (DMT)-like permease